MLYILEVGITTAVDLKIELNRLAERTIYYLVGRKARLGTLQGERTYKEVQRLMEGEDLQEVDYIDNNLTPDEVLINNEATQQFVEVVNKLYKVATNRQREAMDLIINNANSTGGYLKPNDKQSLINKLIKIGIDASIISN